MKFLIDNNLPPAWGKALAALSEKQFPSVEVHALRSRFVMSTPDHEWISALANEGQWAIISIDRFSKGDLERAALRDSGLIVFRLSKQWNSCTYWIKSHAIVRWWPDIVQHAATSPPGVVEVPWTSRSSRLITEKHR